MNRVELSATLLEREALRYTPAGIPIVACRLSHQSVQQEAGQGRTVELEVPAMAVDSLALKLDRTALGTALQVEGFLAPRRRQSRTLVLHMTRFESVGG